jgi:hypothetical protein
MMQEREAQPRDGLHDQREAIRQVIARTAAEPKVTLLAGDDPEAVDFVQPQRSRRQRVGFGWKAACDEASRERAMTQLAGT